jgi:hypothetical protein
VKQKAVNKLPKDISYEDALKILQGQTSVPVAKPNNLIENNKEILISIQQLLEQIQAGNSQIISFKCVRENHDSRKYISLDFYLNDPNDELM